MKRVYVFGTGKHYENHKRLLNLDYKIIGFVDNNSSKWGCLYDGKEVYSPDVLLAEKYDYVIVASTAKNVIIDQLLKMGISHTKINILNCCRLLAKDLVRTNVTQDGFTNYQVGEIRFRCKTRSDYNVVQEIYDDGNYSYHNNKDQFIVIDIGMNIGLASLYFAEKSNVKKVYSYEPFWETYEQAKSNILMNRAEIQDKIETFCIGLEDKNCTKQIIYNEEFSGGMSISETNNMGLENESSGAETIQVRDAGEILEPIFNNKGRNKVLLKVDCEGSEYFIAQSLEKAGIFEQIDVFLMEWHCSVKNDIFTALFEKYGYQYFIQCGNEDRGMMYAIK